MHQNSTRTYLLYVPAAYTGQEEWPLVIHYHGFFLNGQRQMAYTQMNAVADTAYFLVAYPDGLVVEDLISGDVSTGWNVPGGYRADHDDVVFTSSLIDHVAADFRIDPARIHATGWSNGSQMAFYVACVLSDRIASVAGVSGGLTFTLLDSCQAGRPFSAMTIFGTDDLFFPFNGNSQIPPVPSTPSFWAAQNNCSSDSVVTERPNPVNQDGSTVTLIEYVNCDNNSEVLFYRVNNGGHTWPGSTPVPGWEFLRNTNQDINANSEILNFFKRNPHPEPVSSVENIDTSPKTFQLHQNYPNPFNPTTTIAFSLPQSGFVTVKVYNLLGEEVATLLEARKPAGQHTINFDASALASGLYYYTLTAGDPSTGSGQALKQSRKMLLLR